MPGKRTEGSLVSLLFPFVSPVPFHVCLRRLNQGCSQPQSCTRSTCSPEATFQPSLPPHASPATSQAAPTASTLFIPPGSTQDDGVYENAMETYSSINTSMSLDTIMPGPEDYAIESLATSLMGGAPEATTETFYTGKHMRMGNMRLDNSPVLHLGGIPHQFSQNT
jgi:hypothetical protein